MKDLSSIKFIPIKEAVLIPRYLFDQVKDLPFTADNFYQYYGFYSESPFSLLFAIADCSDTDQPIKGVIWAGVEPIVQGLHVNLVSLHPDYQRSGLFKEKILPFLDGLKVKLGLKVGSYCTTRPKAFMKISEGRYKISKLVLMDDDIGGENGK